MRLLTWLAVGLAASLPYAALAAAPPSQHEYVVNLGLGSPAPEIVPGGVTFWIDTTNTSVNAFGLPRPVSDQSPMPVTVIGGGSGGGGSLNIAQFGGMTVNLGQQPSAASIPVAIASDQPALPVTGNIGLAAGSKIGIDQTTPGTTNAVSPQGVVATTAPSSSNGSTQGLRLDAGNRLLVNGSEVPQPVTGSISVSNLPTTQTVAGSVSVSNLPTTQQIGGSVTVANPGVPDSRAGGQALNAATANAAISIALNNAQATVGFAVSGLTASAATLTAEGSNDGGTTWSSINTTAPGTGLLSTTVVADGQFRVNGAGHTNVRLRVSTTGTGTITVADNASSVTGLIALSAQLPAGSNQIGSVAVSNLPTTQAVTGNVGGYTGSAQVSPTVSTSAYATGQSVGGLLTLSGLVRPSQSGALIQSIMLAFADSQTPSIDMVFFASNPTASTIANGSTMSVAAADIGKIRGVAHVSDCTNTGTTSVCQAQQQALSLVAGTAGGPVYAALIARSAMTLANTSDLTVTVTGPQD